jgi:hypothetical protein
MGDIIYLSDYLNKRADPKCNHGIVFDEEAAKTMTIAEIRQKFPRLDGICTKCGWSGIYYASTAHYVYGDW